MVCVERAFLGNLFYRNHYLLHLQVNSYFSKGPLATSLK
jgi:hypothetical protein